MKNRLSILALLMLFMANYFSCQRDKNTMKLTRENVQAIADEYGVPITWDETPDTNAINGTAPIMGDIEEVRKNMKELAKLDQAIKARNEHNAKRYKEFREAESKAQNEKDSLAIALKYPDVVSMDRAAIERCIELGLLTKHDKGIGRNARQ